MEFEKKEKNGYIVFICPKCESEDVEIEQDFDEGELLAEDIVCGNCGYMERIY